jgi:transposase
MMEEKIEVGKTVPRKNGPKKRAKVTYPYELRLKAVKLNLEKGISRDVISRELGVGESSVSNWIKAYREEGEGGLRNKPFGARPGQKKLPEPVTARIVELKKAEPTWGVKRIAQVLRRMFWLPGSPETVRTRLHEAGLMNQERAKGRRNLTRPRFFERATPNQMWQTDIFKNEAHREPDVCLQLARAYLTAADPMMSKRTWETTMAEIVLTKRGSTQKRWITACKDEAFDFIRYLKLTETRAEQFWRVLNTRTVSPTPNRHQIKA